MIDQGIKRLGQSPSEIREAMNQRAVLELEKLERFLSVLNITGRIAPMFGFIGTIIGLVMLLKDFATISNPSVSQIADAMYVKLITSATGLLIGMMAYLGHNYLDKIK